MSFEQLPDLNDELLSEYRFDYAEAISNRFASTSGKPKKVVILDDVGQVFKTPKSVNCVLRAPIETMPYLADNKTV